MQKNTVFRGCTRPATFLGVPYVPFFIGAGSGLMLGMYFNMFFFINHSIHHSGYAANGKARRYDFSLYRIKTPI